MADHGDHLTNIRGLSIDAPQYETTDFFIFSRGDKLVLTAAFDPSFSGDSSDLIWPRNFDLRFNLDLDSEVEHGKNIDGVDFDAVAGGYIPNPDNISEDVVIHVSFDGDNQPVVVASGSGDYTNAARKINKSLDKAGRGTSYEELKEFYAGEKGLTYEMIKKGLGANGSSGKKGKGSSNFASIVRADPDKVSVYAGLRAEQFLFGPLVRTNRPTIAIEIDKKILFGGKGDQTVLAWAQSIIEDGENYTDSSGMEMTAHGGPYIDLAGRALRSQFPVDLRMINALHPSEHVKEGFVYPDVAIYDTSEDAEFPNGRFFSDDVITYLAPLKNTTPPSVLQEMTIPGNGDSNQGTVFAAEVEITLDPDSRYPGGADAGDIRTWAGFPYHGLPYNIPTEEMPEYPEYRGSEFVHRYFDELTGSFYYTSTKTDIAFWDSLPSVESQGIVFPAATYRGKAVHRFFNTKNGSYFWTIDPEEFDELKNTPNSKFIYQGETFFVDRPASAGGPSVVSEYAIEVRRLYNADADRYVWTSNQQEIEEFRGMGFDDEEILAWTISPPDTV